MAPRFRYRGPPIAVTVLSRPNRFLARVRVEPRGRVLLAHVPNPGRMEELLVPGVSRGYVIPADGPGRRTKFDLVSVRHGRTLVSVDTRVANRLVRERLEDPTGLRMAPGRWRAEVAWGPHRFDFARLDSDGSRVLGLLEVKSSNLRVGRYAMFPDAPTVRGASHLRTLALARSRGIDAQVIFVVQRIDVEAFTPNRVLDPEFARAFDQALKAGVRMSAYRIRVSPGSVAWTAEIPVHLVGSGNL